MTLDANDESVRIQYLKRQLTAEQEMAFEEYLMEHPQMVRELEMTQALLDTAPEAFAQINDNLLVRLWQKMTQSWVGFPVGAVLGGALAAMLLLVVLPNNEIGVYSSPNVVFLETTKGNANFETQVQTDKHGMSTLFIQTADIEPTEYQMELLGTLSGQVFKTKQVAANGNGELILVLDFSQISEQRVELALNNIETKKRDVHRLVVLRP